MENQSTKQRTIKDIKNEDIRIQITGYVKNLVEKETFLLDDNTGKIQVKIENLEKFPFQNDDLINIIGDLNISMEGEKEVDAQIVQDMKSLNFDYYQKLYELKKKL